MTFKGFFLISLAFLLLLKLLNFEIDSFYRSFKNIKYDALKMRKTRGEDIEEISVIIEDAEPLSGCGMFEITKSTLTSMLSISVTYLIILIQFKMSI